MVIIMIFSYRFAVSPVAAGDCGRAYLLYSALLRLLPKDCAAAVHSGSGASVAQFLYFDDANKRSVWQLSVFGEVADAVSQTLDGLSSLRLNGVPVTLTLLEKTVLRAEELIASARETAPLRSVVINVLSPTAFKQDGRYTVLPSEKLTVQSLTAKWNAAFPEHRIDDAEAVMRLTQGVFISDHSLSCRHFRLKGVSIPGFLGTFTLSSCLTGSDAELFALLMRFSEFSGLGIKTALGMGGVEIKY